jgi:succinate dehydrogenase/fumarate reductase flavoprotein subunit
LIVGSGAAGALAAIDAASAGANVLVLEALPGFGGTAAVCGGGICIAGSDLQAQQSISDTPESALEDWLTFDGPAARAQSQSNVSRFTSVL